jgi:hypothetical protein
MRSECLNSTFTLRLRIAVSHRIAPSTLRVGRSTRLVKSPKTISAARSTRAKKAKSCESMQFSEWHVTCIQLYRRHRPGNQGEPSPIETSPYIG